MTGMDEFIWLYNNFLTAQGTSNGCVVNESLCPMSANELLSESKQNGTGSFWIHSLSDLSLFAFCLTNGT